mgnify:CR=1 FL=1
MSTEEELAMIKRQFRAFKDDAEAALRKLKDEIERLERRVRDLERR